MESFKKTLKKIFFLPPLPTLIIAILGYTFVLLVPILHINTFAIQIAAYVCSAYALIVTVTGLHYLSDLAGAVKRYVNNHPLMKKMQATAFGSRFLSDVRFRSDVSLYQGLFINLLYIAVKLFSGIYYRSYWFVALAVYYMLLAVMRFMLLPSRKTWTDRPPMETELRRYRLCGIVLLLMNQALMGIVVYMVQQHRGFNYPGLLIYAMALYSFYSVITAVINLIKFRKHGSPVMSAVKAINLVAAMVSILSLETAMLAQFNGDAEDFRIVMTSVTGGGVCTIVIGMAIFMIWKSTRDLKRLQINNS